MQSKTVSDVGRRIRENPRKKTAIRCDVLAPKASQILRSNPSLQGRATHSARPLTDHDLYDFIIRVDVNLLARREVLVEAGRDGLPTREAILARALEITLRED